MRLNRVLAYGSSTRKKWVMLHLLSFWCMSICVLSETATEVEKINKANSCLPGDEQCSTDDECCSDNCITGFCSIGCTVAGKECDRPSDCCSRNCHNYDPDIPRKGVCQEGDGCTDGGGLCGEDSHLCCSGNCHNGQCEIGAEGCTFEGGWCQAQSYAQCCLGLLCVDHVCSTGSIVISTSRIAILLPVLVAILKSLYL